MMGRTAMKYCPKCSEVILKEVRKDDRLIGLECYHCGKMPYVDLEDVLRAALRQVKELCTLPREIESLEESNRVKVRALKILCERHDLHPGSVALYIADAKEEMEDERRHAEYEEQKADALLEAEKARREKRCD